MDEIILIDKPDNMTSFGVVARLRRVLSKKAGKKVKVGHTGTLDPFATGLMIIVTGKKCREAMTYTKLDKVYEATFVLGKKSTTGDIEGEITDYNQAESRIPTREEIDEIAKKFVGKIKQKPPVFSAIKINGKRAYKLARDGVDIEMPEREVEIYSLDVVDYNYPELKICTHVSSGTYIRSLAVDIGEALGVGAYCSELRRTKIADWSVSDAYKLEYFGIYD